MEEIQKNDYNLNISRYVSITKEEEPIDLSEVHKKLISLDELIKEKTEEHNKF